MNKYFLFLIYVLILIGTRASAQVNLQLGLIACYPFNNSPLDSTSNNLDLTPSGFPAAAPDRFGNIDGAYSFNSSNPDYFTALLDPLLAPSEVTVAAWVYLTDAAHDQKIAGRAEVNGGGYLLGVDSNKIDAEIWDMTGAHFRLRVKFVPSNTWTHLAMSYKANEYLRVYIDGNLKDSLPASVYGVGTTGFWTFTVGGAPWQPGVLNPNGIIDDIYIYSRAINNAEVDALYNLNPTSIKEFDSRINSMYPVPLRNGALVIDFKSKTGGKVDVQIIDAIAKKVFSAEIENPQRENLDLSHLQNGVYSVLIIDGDKTEAHQLIVEK